MRRGGGLTPILLSLSRCGWEGAKPVGSNRVCWYCHLLHTVVEWDN